MRTVIEIQCPHAFLFYDESAGLIYVHGILPSIPGMRIINTWVKCEDPELDFWPAFDHMKSSCEEIYGSVEERELDGFLEPHFRVQPRASAETPFYSRITEEFFLFLPSNLIIPIPPTPPEHEGLSPEEFYEAMGASYWAERLRNAESYYGPLPFARLYDS